MPSVITRPSVVETTLGITFQIGELPTQTVANYATGNSNPISEALNRRGFSQVVENRY